jgi:hypothetical protein
MNTIIIKALRSHHALQHALQAFSESEVRSLLWREERGKQRASCLRMLRCRLRRMRQLVEVCADKGLRPRRDDWQRDLRQRLANQAKRRALQKRFLKYATPAQIAAKREHETIMRRLRRRCKQVNLRFTQRGGTVFVSDPKRPLYTARDALKYGSPQEVWAWLRYTYVIDTRARKRGGWSKKHVS